MQKYSIENATDFRRDPTILSAWRELLSVSTSTQKVYQTPEFFEVLVDTNNGNDHIEILTIRNSDTKQIVGIIPIRFRRQSFRFSLGSRLLVEPSFEAITLLGSVPLISAEHDAFVFLLRYLFETYPSCSALSMPSLGFDSVWHAYIQGSVALESEYFTFVIDEWRDCHLIPLAKSFEEYLQRFSSKRRFNLRRQVRLLREFIGTDFQLDRIEQVDQIPSFIAARNNVVPAEVLPLLLSPKTCQGLAKQGLFLSYVLRAGERTYAVIIATRSENKLLIHNICFHPDVAHLSAGMSILYLAIDDLIGNTNIDSIDLGYSNPANNHNTSNKIEIRGHMLLLRKTWKNRFLISTHQAYTILFGEIKKISKNQIIRKLLDWARRQV